MNGDRTWTRQVSIYTVRLSSVGEVDLVDDRWTDKIDRPPRIALILRLCVAVRVFITVIR